MSVKLITGLGVLGLIGNFYKKELYTQLLAPNCSTRKGTLKIEYFTDAECNTLDSKATEESKRFTDDFYTLDECRRLGDHQLQQMGLPTSDPNFNRDDANRCVSQCVNDM